MESYHSSLVGHGGGGVGLMCSEYIIIYNIDYLIIYNINLTVQ